MSHVDLALVSPQPRATRVLLTACTLALAAGLSACGGSAPDPEPTQESGATNAATPADSTSSPSASASADKDPKAAKESKEAQAIAEVAHTFSALAPESFFTHFDSCNPSGLEGSPECTGAASGQFQFFNDRAKADSTVELLTGLQSSHIVSDDGSRIVGWSTLGSTAVITVVDRKAGQLMQQPVSSGKIDPMTRLIDLGLVDAAAATPSPTASVSPTASAHPTPSAR